jgi:hypothetical protein
MARLSMNRPAWVRSTTPISKMMPVVRNKKMIWLDSDGFISFKVVAIDALINLGITGYTCQISDKFYCDEITLKPKIL